MMASMIRRTLRMRIGFGVAIIPRLGMTACEGHGRKLVFLVEKC